MHRTGDRCRRRKDEKVNPLPPHLADLDTIQIENLTVRTVIGILDRERDRHQEVCLQLTLWTDIRPAGKSDKIEDAVDYRSLTKKIIEHVAASSCFLIERLAEEIARLVLDEKGVEAVRLKVEKPGALRHTSTVAIEIFRTSSS